VNRKIFWFVVTILVLSILTNLIISKKITFAKIANLFSKKNGQTQLSQKDPYNAPAPKFIWGVGIMTTPTNVRDAGVLEQLLQDAKNLGITAVRIDWPDYIKIDDYEYMDTVVNAILAKNLKVVMVVAQDQNLFQKENYYQIGYNDAVALVSHYQGKINYYQIGNEPAGNVVNPSWPGLTEESYNLDLYQKEIAWLKGFSDGVKKADPHAKRVANGHWLHIGFFDMAIRDGLQFEILGWDWDQKDNLDLSKVKNDGQEYNLLEKLKSFKKELWLTEVNAFKGSLYGEDAQVQYLQTIIPRIYDSGAFSGLFVFRLTDESHKIDSDEKSLGLIKLKYQDGQWWLGDKKPAYYTFKDLIKKYTK